MITLAKRGDLHARRQALSIVREKDVVHKLFEEAAERFGGASGGYARTAKVGRRHGDAALLTLIELVGPVKGRKKKKATGKKDKVEAPKKDKPEKDKPEKDKPEKDKPEKDKIDVKPETVQSDEPPPEKPDETPDEKPDEIADKPDTPAGEEEIAEAPQDDEPPSVRTAEEAEPSGKVDQDGSGEDIPEETPVDSSKEEEKKK